MMEFIEVRVQSRAPGPPQDQTRQKTSPHQNKSINEKTRAIFLTHAQGFNGLTNKLIDYSKDQIIERNDNSVSISSIKLDSSDTFLNVSGLLQFLGTSSKTSYQFETKLPKKSNFLNSESTKLAD